MPSHCCAICTTCHSASVTLNRHLHATDGFSDSRVFVEKCSHKLQQQISIIVPFEFSFLDEKCLPCRSIYGQLTGLIYRVIFLFMPPDASSTMSTPIPKRSGPPPPPPRTPPSLPHSAPPHPTSEGLCEEVDHSHHINVKTAVRLTNVMAHYKMC